jgi:hypothetical protein
LANKLGTASEILNKKVKIAYENLPAYLQQGVVIWNVNSFILENGSSVNSLATTPDSVRGVSANLLIVDECAFIRDSVWQEFSKSSFPVISSGQTSRIILVSTPNGYNHFYDLYNKALLKKNKFIAHKIMWYDRPDRTQEWADAERQFLGDSVFLQEYCAEFLGQSGTLIQGSILKRMIESIVNFDLIPISENRLFSNLEKYWKNIRVFKLPVPGHVYISSHDSATNTDEESGDSACVQIIDITSLPFEQVAVADFVADTAYLEIPHVQVEMGRIYNNAFIFNENNEGAGRESNYIIVNEIGYENIYWEKPKVPGYRTTVLTKAKGCTNIKNLIEHGYIKIYDSTTIHQFFQFVRSAGSYAATEGNHDDSVMALIGTVFFLMLEQEKIEEFFGNDSDCYYRLPNIADLLKIIYTTKNDNIEEAVVVEDDGVKFNNPLLNVGGGLSLNQMIESGGDSPAALMRMQEKMKTMVTTLRGAEYDREDDSFFNGYDDDDKPKRKKTIDDLIFGD